MIYEYALEPEMVATWAELHSQPHFKRAFGLGQGRIVSRYPKNWAKMVWDSFSGSNDMDKKRLEELLVRLKETMVKRKDCCWNDPKGSWLQNVLHEHARHQFFAIMSRYNPGGHREIFTEADLSCDTVEKWDVPHGCIVPRKAQNMIAAIEMMLTICRWVKFIDPYIVKFGENYKLSFKAFLEVLGRDRPVGSPETIEIHVDHNANMAASTDFLKNEFAKIIPPCLSLNLFRWKELPVGQDLHNRFILTDLGGVSFHHGLDVGPDGQTDNISRLDRAEYEFLCSQYDSKGTAFDLAEPPIQIVGDKWD